MLWIALVLNLAMFAVEVGAGWRSGSVSLLADAIDFFGDAFNYGLSLAVLSMAQHVRSRTAIFKAVCMAAFGVLVFRLALCSWQPGVIPAASPLGPTSDLAPLGHATLALPPSRHHRGPRAPSRAVERPMYDEAWVWAKQEG